MHRRGECLSRWRRNFVKASSQESKCSTFMEGFVRFATIMLPSPSPGSLERRCERGHGAESLLAKETRIPQTDPR